MASSSSSFFLEVFLFCAFLLVSTKHSLASTSQDLNLSTIRSFCQSTPYPDVCFDSLKLSLSLNNSPQNITYALETLQYAVSEAEILYDLLFSIAGNSIIEKQRGTIEGCKELHQITVSCLKYSIARVKSANSQKLEDARAFLSAALTNKNTCLEGLESASGLLKPALVDSIISFYKLVSNSLSIVSNQGILQDRANRRLLDTPKREKGSPMYDSPAISMSGKGQRYENFPTLSKTLFPEWLSHKSRRILESSVGKYDPNRVLTVAQDGTGNFTTITDAINFAPNNSNDRVIIYVREGIYQENVDIPSYKTNIVLLGYGSDVTVVTGSRSVADGWSTYGSATVAVAGKGFLARDIAFENTAGPEKHQAVALRINADFAALYRCTVRGYQATLYVHSFRQFYRECDILGTIDFIFGNGAVVFQASNIISRMPMPGQFTVITAQSRDTEDQSTGISIQNCSVLATNDLYSNFSSSSKSVKSYLGRPWRIYSRTVYLDSFIDDFIDPTGWTQWSGNEGLDTLYYGEYNNNGPGSGTEHRVSWSGYHVMDYSNAANFTVSKFIAGNEWLDSTGFPYDDGI